jgi:hypothetical protein
VLRGSLDNSMGMAAMMEESFEAMTIGKLLYLVLFGESAIRPLDAPKPSNQSQETEELPSGGHGSPLRSKFRRARDHAVSRSKRTR